jgi:chemotaxis methyl-accepting protein methylase
VSYSEFFRNPLTFSVLERIVLPLLISTKQKKSRKEIRIWSAACAAGQEVYSLAMLLEETKLNTVQKINYRIFATDISESQIQIARDGCYNIEAFNLLIPKRISKWFSSQGENYFVDPVLKNWIEFSVFDQLNEKLSCPVTSIFGDFDIVFCSNLLFYYKPKFQKKILEKLSGSLTTDGYLITGETEREILFQLNYNEVYPHSAIFQKF